MRARKNTACTIGYEGTAIDDFLRALHSHRIEHLIDICEMPLSRKKGFSKTALALHLEQAGVRYSHVRALGCPKPIRDRYRIDGDWNRYSRAFTAYLESQTEALHEVAKMIALERCSLMCFEADYTRCHPSLVVQRLGGPVLHITAPRIRG